MSSRVNRKVQLIILLVLVCLVGTMSIAYAVLSTTLNINGTAQVQDASWNVHFSNVQVNPYSVDINPVITDNNKITFSADLTTPGDFYKFTVDIVNEGSIDAMIESIIKTPELTVEQKKYLRYEVEYADGISINDSQLLKAGETKTISILFSYRNDIPVSDLPSSETEFDLEIALVYVQADSTGQEVSRTDSLIKVVSGNLNTVGSEICIGNECFYVISSDDINVTMLAKYNLLVGKLVADNTWATTFLENPTGIQDSTSLAAIFDSNKMVVFPFIGTTNFTNTNYWWDSTENTFKSEYFVQKGELYPYVYDSNSLISQHVENYKSYIQNMGITVNESRLIKYEELVKLGCDKDNVTCISTKEWTYSTSYWTGSAYDSVNAFRVTSDGRFNYNNVYYDSEVGVRPVLEIPLTEF